MLIAKGADGKRIENNIIQMNRDLIHGEFRLEDLKFFAFLFKKLLEATENVIKRAEETIDAHH